MNKLYIIFTFIILSIITSNETNALPNCVCYALAAAGTLTGCSGIAFMELASQEPYDPMMFHIGAGITVLGGVTTISSCVQLCCNQFVRERANLRSSTSQDPDDIEMGAGGHHNFNPMNWNQHYPSAPPMNLPSNTTVVNNGIATGYPAHDPVL